MELFVAPALVPMPRRGARGRVLALRDDNFFKSWVRPDPTGMMGRAFRRFSVRTAVARGDRYEIRAQVRNNKDFPLSRDVRGWLEVVWLDQEGREVARSAREVFAGGLSSREWQPVQLSGEVSGPGAVEAVVSIVLRSSTGRGEGSVCVRGLTVEPVVVASRSAAHAFHDSSRVH
ncbi:MAG TPA: hypothetical protein VIH35_07575 [Kiritimatiellia bacterium]